MDEIKDTAARTDESEHKGRRAVRVVCNVMCVVCAVLVLINLYTVVSGIVRPNMPPRLFGMSVLIVTNESMEGDLPDSVAEGTLAVTVRYRDLSKYAEDDIVVFCEDGSCVVGRIYDIRSDEEGETYFLVKADNQPAYYTDRVTKEKLVGRVWLRMEKLGDLVLRMDSVGGLILFMGIPWLVCLGIVGYELHLFQKARKNTESK